MPALNSPKQNLHAPTKAESAHCTTSARLSKYAQSQKLSSLTSQKYWIFPHRVRDDLPISEMGFWWVRDLD